MASAHAALFAGLPAPRPGELTAYVLGPGYGESQVLALPDGKWLAVDCCQHGGVNLPLELLRHFDVSTIDLFVLTHPDLDHHKGLPELIQNLSVRKLWRYPGFQTLRELILLLEKTESDPRFAEMRRAHEAMAPLMASPKGEEVSYGHRWWPKGAPYQVHCIAPSSSEKSSWFEALPEFMRRLQRGGRLTLTETQRFMERGNELSLALIIWWNEVGILLGGDVESPAVNSRGWRAVLANLAEDDDLEDRGLRLIQGLRLVKASHHGSEGAFCEEAWTHHGKTGLVELAVVTRFNRGRNPPPQTEGLDPLRRFARRLALTSEPTAGWSVVTGAGWVRVAHPSGPGAAGCVAVTLAPQPPSQISLSAQAGLFESATAGP